MKQFNRTLVDDILDLVSKGQGQSLTDIFSKSQKQELVLCRQIIAYLIKEVAIPEMSLSNAGSCILKNHATVIHSIRTIKDRMCTEKALAARINEYESIVRLMKPQPIWEYCSEELHLIEYQN